VLTKATVTAEVLWGVRQPNGEVISCRLFKGDAYDFEVMMFVGRERVHSRRFPNRSSAELEADSMKDRIIAAVGGVPLAGRRVRQ
jgi:hypothetical protein